MRSRIASVGGAAAAAEGRLRVQRVTRMPTMASPTATAIPGMSQTRRLNPWRRGASRIHSPYLSTKYWTTCFFFQAEDGIRGTSVTGVQTCALPISHWAAAGAARRAPLDRPAAGPPPELVAAGEGAEIVADYASLGLTLGRHPLALLRARLKRLGQIGRASCRERGLSTDGVAGVTRD